MATSKIISKTSASSVESFVSNMLDRLEVLRGYDMADTDFRQWTADGLAQGVRRIAWSPADLHVRALEFAALQGRSAAQAAALIERARGNSAD